MNIKFKLPFYVGSSKKSHVFQSMRLPRITSICVLILFHISFSLQNHIRTRHEGLNVTIKLATNETGVVTSFKKQNSIELSVRGAHGIRVLPSHSSKPMVSHNATSLCATTEEWWQTVFAWMRAAALVAVTDAAVRFQCIVVRLMFSA